MKQIYLAILVWSGRQVKLIWNHISIKNIICKRLGKLITTLLKGKTSHQLVAFRLPHTPIYYIKSGKNAFHTKQTFLSFKIMYSNRQIPGGFMWQSNFQLLLWSILVTKYLLTSCQKFHMADNVITDVYKPIYVPFLLNVITNHPNYVSLLWEKQFLEHSKHCSQLASLSDIYVLCYISFSKSMVRHENQNKVQKLNDSPVEQMLTAAFCWC